MEKYFWRNGLSKELRTEKQMKLEYSIHGQTHSGKDAYSFVCTDCNLSHSYNLETLMYDPRINFVGAQKEKVEFVLHHINSNELFNISKSGRFIKILRERLCFCDPKIRNLQTEGSIRRAKEILRLGLEQLNNVKT